MALGHETHTPVIEPPVDPGVDPVAAYNAAYNTGLDPLYTDLEAQAPPEAEVGLPAVEPDVMATSGLRQAVAAGRAAKHEQKAQRILEKAEDYQDIYDRTINAMPIPYKPSEYTGGLRGSINAWNRKRFVKQMTRYRKKNNTEKHEADVYTRGYGRPFDRGHNRNPIPYRKASTLGTSVGLSDFLSVPRTRQEIKGYYGAVEKRDHAEHVIHENKEAAHGKIGRLQAKARRQSKKSNELRERSVSIANREDKVSKAYDNVAARARTRWVSAKTRVAELPDKYVAWRDWELNNPSRTPEERRARVERVARMAGRNGRRS